MVGLVGDKIRFFCSLLLEVADIVAFEENPLLVDEDGDNDNSDNLFFKLRSDKEQSSPLGKDPN
eukprot:CAMPEP_0170789976 /NCGR_PEP_ID=MMETSP0733-20121128/20093_1 /TAXON_ID=186038 /ORGANISM="Fragilariopsis kerguelensis, Strain L26-C5" /LENGTH=63 /DNA_ID=CAMNT_0011137265 /DNA_START=668 /DNA_END=859 /DNA_ORIENTATION=-